MELKQFCKENNIPLEKLGDIGYDATDYRFIRFNYTHMAWLWRNGNLLRVYG